MKKRPISTSSFDFEQLILENNMYVDKTRYVYSLVKGRLQNFYFLSRPRRYGKSLMCSTLECLFKGKRDLFKGLYIAEHTDYSFEKYPVLHFNFSLLTTDTYEDFMQGFKTLVRMEALANGIEIEEKYPSYMLLDFLSRIEKNAVIIVDEFDAPVIHCLNDKEKLDRVRDAFSSFYSVIKNKESKVRFFFITGVTKLSNMSIFSQMNNLTDLSMNEGYAAAFGYTEEELEENFSEYIDDYLRREDSPYKSREEFISDIRDYYDGYRFSPDTDVKVYNPVSVGSFFLSGCRFKNYWNETGVSTLAVELAKRYDLLNIVEEIPSAGISAFSAFDIGEIAGKKLNASKVYALLYYTGYLTIKDSVGNLLFLSFPNKEISTSFTISLVSRYVDETCDVESITELGKYAASMGDTEALISKIKEYYEMFPYDFIEKRSKEKSFQLIFHSFFVSAGSDVYAEEHSLRGRADNIIKSRNHIYVVELKVDKSADRALEQIREKGYYKKYQKKGAEIHLLGINFSSEKREISQWKEEII